MNSTVARNDSENLPHLRRPRNAARAIGLNHYKHDTFHHVFLMPEVLRAVARALFTSRETRTARLNMTTKLLLAALGLVALAATPVMARTHHVQTHHLQIHRLQTERIAPPVAYEPGYRLPDDYHYYDGFQGDRQMVGVGPESP
jgi:hypothetical protein